MKHIFILGIVIIAALSTKAQTDQKEYKSKFGIKAGYNFSNVIGSHTSFDPKHNNGYMIAGFSHMEIKTDLVTEVSWCIQSKVTALMMAEKTQM